MVVYKTLPIRGYLVSGIDSMKADQDRLLQERANQLRKRLKSEPGNKENIEEELAEVEEKIKRTVCVFLYST